jgi:hypothetical protein
MYGNPGIQSAEDSFDSDGNALYILGKPNI